MASYFSPNIFFEYQNKFHLIPSQLWYLWMMGRYPGKTIDYLSEISGVSRSTIYGYRNSLIEDGWMDEAGNIGKLLTAVEAEIVGTDEPAVEVIDDGKIYFDTLEIHEKLFVLDGFECRLCHQPLEQKKIKERYGLRKVVKGNNFFQTRVLICGKCGHVATMSSDEKERLEIYIKARAIRLKDRVGSTLTDEEVRLLNFVNSKLGKKHRHFEKKAETEGEKFCPDSGQEILPNVGEKKLSEIWTKREAKETEKREERKERTKEKKEESKEREREENESPLREMSVATATDVCPSLNTPQNLSEIQTLKNISNKGVQDDEDFDEDVAIETRDVNEPMKGESDAKKHTEAKMAKKSATKKKKYDKRLAETMAKDPEDWKVADGAIYVSDKVWQKFPGQVSKITIAERNTHAQTICDACNGDMSKFQPFVDWVLDNWTSHWFVEDGTTPSVRNIAIHADDLFGRWQAGGEIKKAVKKRQESESPGAVVEESEHVLVSPTKQYITPEEAAKGLPFTV